MRQRICSTGLLVLLMSARVAEAADDTTIVRGNCLTPDIKIKTIHNGQVQFDFAHATNPVGLGGKELRNFGQINDYFHLSAATPDDAVIALCDATQSQDEVVGFLQ